jgi:glycolate oxidase
VCSIGGNVAENSGGVHCLKYGLTTNNVHGAEVVLPDGAIIRVGGKQLEHDVYDLLGLLTGSEGLLGVVTEVTVRILPRPECAAALLASFDEIEAAGACVAAIIARGVIPAGMEIMDRLATNAAEDYCAPGYPRDAGAVLLLEIDGGESEVAEQLAEVRAAAEACGATGVVEARDDAARTRMWAGRKAAFPAVGRIADYYCMDGTIPRRELPRILGRIRGLARDFGLEVANVFHAGDGNLHPLILYDANEPEQLERAEALGAEILKLCVEHGGVLTGEHGVGVEKRDLMGTMFSEIDLAQQERVKCAFDPEGRLNPGKVFPVLHRCAELGRVHVHAGRTRFPDIPRF